MLPIIDPFSKQGCDRLGTNLGEREQVLFLNITVPIWGFLGGYGSVLAHRTLESNPLENPVLPWRDTSPPAETTQGPRICENCKTANPFDALYCKNCGSKLGLVSSRTWYMSGVRTISTIGSWNSYKVQTYV